ncbi:unnamed protein product [Durusdinium trenchii]|uniref:Uncharacterized protein n=2 Tax=Durusdinium trenchii TaxID=1381693 RepID=A0ABP0KG64_9DINO
MWSTATATSANVQPPEQHEMAPVILSEERYLKPDPTASLAKVSADEGSALLKLNTEGLQEFFNRKACKAIGEVLAKEKINGTTLAQLTNKHIEDLALSLGDKLSLHGFMNRFRSSARAAKRSESLWEAEEFPYEYQLVSGAGTCCPKPEKPILYHRLPRPTTKSRTPF